MNSRLGRSLIQRTLFAGPASWASEDLYCKIETGVVLRRRGSIALQAGAIVHTNAYFGRFEASYWQRWSTVGSVQVSVRVSGPEGVGLAEGVIRVRASDIGSHVRTIAVAHVGGGDGDSGPQTVTLDAPIDKFLDGGAMWLEFRAIDGPLTFDEVRWSADGAGAGRPTAIAICTYNRADDCANTVAALASDSEVLGIIDTVYVTDQGTDLVQTRPVYQDAADSLGAKLHYLRQANLGGAGGFSRGMFEVTAGTADANVLLMDDDVRVEPETILRMTALANHAMTPTLIGAQMLYLYNPDYLLVSAESVDLPELQAGLPADEWCLQDQSVIDNIQERRIDAPYNAWWSCLIPASVVREIGLPMPYFFQWDDIEYGIRAGSRGFPTVTLPGAAVWHADFYWKDGDDFGQFFGQRNSLITAAIHSDFEVRALAKVLSRRVSQAIVAMQYGYARTLLSAITAFLEGPATLADGGQAALSKVRAEREHHPETKMSPISELPTTIPVRRAVGQLKEGREDLVLAKRALGQLSGRVQRGPVAIAYEDAHWWHVSLFDEAYVTDASQTGVRLRRRDPALAKSLSVELAKTIKRFHADAAGVRAQFRAAVPELTSRGNWARLYGSD
ncbi:glycosyltransferase [Tomitella biformata]|uniref:glycosyltransferase n=1 Tax=Tomitella biformata TaxID=630403 RepID=UPI0004666661|nr:glycosyltransferase [Tomitella biformata]